MIGPLSVSLLSILRSACSLNSILVGTNSFSECEMNLYECLFSFSLSNSLSLSLLPCFLLSNLKDRPVFRNFSFTPTAVLVCLLVTRNGQTMSVATRRLWNLYWRSILGDRAMLHSGPFPLSQVHFVTLESNREFYKM